MAVGFAACFSAMEKQGETRCPLLHAGQTQQQCRARVGSGSPRQGGGRGAAGPQNPAFQFPLIRDERAFGGIRSPAEPSTSSLAHESPPQN